MLSELIADIIDLIFPTHCLECGCGGEMLCHACSEQIRTAPHPSVLVRPTEHVDYLIRTGPYQDRIIQMLIHHLKFSGCQDLAKPLAARIVLVLQRYMTGHPVIIPVPLHWRRRALRGYNQSELIAQHIAHELSLPIDTRLTRVRNTHQQARLSKARRLTNLQHAFAYQGRTAPHKVLLVDDVATTMATLENAAMTLKQNGADYVGAVVVAHDD